MRIRQVKPAFWGDARLAALPAATRLFYVGLWCIADDAGWLELDIPSIGHELYGYETRPRRERTVRTMLGQLTEIGRLVEHPCGHGEIPTLPEHQRLSGATKQVKTVLNAHMKGCVTGPRTSPQVPAIVAGEQSPHIPATFHAAPPRNGKERERVRNGKERSGTVASARGSDEPTTETEFQRLVARPA